MTTATPLTGCVAGEWTCPPLSSSMHWRGIMGTVVVLLLVSLLGHADFRTREAAHACLAGYGAQLWPLYVATAADGDRDPEVRSRCHALAEASWSRMPVVQKQAVVAGICPRGWRGKLPWISSLPLMANDYLWAAQAKGHGSRSPHWHAHREATRLWLADMVAAGFTPQELLSILEAMADGDRKWCRNNHVPLPVGRRWFSWDSWP